MWMIGLEDTSIHKLSIKGKIANVLDFAIQESKSRILCREKEPRFFSEFKCINTILRWGDIQKKWARLDQ